MATVFLARHLKYVQHSPAPPLAYVADGFQPMLITSNFSFCHRWADNQHEGSKIIKVKAVCRCTTEKDARESEG